MAMREQERARFALGKIKSVRDLGNRDDYRTQLVKLPARLHTSGFGQTVAFYLSEGADSEEAKICAWIEEWLRPGKAGIYPAGRDLIDAITAGTPEDYRRAGAETRALSTWLKRFAEAFIEGQHGTSP